jgi:propanol-preferring alcohol dehydrogenase
MTLLRPGTPLEMQDRETPLPGPHEVLIRVRACGICRTDLHIADGELSPKRPAIVPGHEIVGIVEKAGAGAQSFLGKRVGVPWLGGVCGECPYCRAGEENLCDAPTFTGWNRDGGYATEVIADSRFCFPVPDVFGDAEAAPLLCAGLIGYRCWRVAGPPERVRRLGLFGFGAAAHILAQVAQARGQAVYSFTRPGDSAAQAFARDMGCVWAGGSDEPSPDPLDAAIIFAPIGSLVPIALAATRKGGVVVCGGIHMSDIPSFPYRLLWEERRVVSVANLTRKDGAEFLPLAAEIGVRTHPVLYPLAQANEALNALRAGTFSGAAVLTMEQNGAPS